MNSCTRPIALTAGLLGFLGVALGAFGAHALKDILAARGSTDIWHTAVLYQLVHSVALLALCGWREMPVGLQKWTARCWAGGVVLFSGSLYWLALGGPKFLGPVTPLGGIGLLAGWVLVVAIASKGGRP